LRFAFRSFPTCTTTKYGRQLLDAELEAAADGCLKLRFAFRRFQTCTITDFMEHQHKKQFEAITARWFLVGVLYMSKNIN